MDMARPAGSPQTITLNGNTYLVGQPTPGEMGAITAKLKKICKTPAAALLEDPELKFLPEEEQKQLIAEAVRKKVRDGVPFDPLSALEALADLDLCRFIAWLMIRKNHPDFTYEKACEAITEENRFLIAVELDALTGMGDLGNSAGQPGSAPTEMAGKKR